MSSNDQNNHGSGYRLKFRKDEFLYLIKLADPKLIYKVSDFYYFNYDGFTMYSEDISEVDLEGYVILSAIEFSSHAWSKHGW